MSDEKAPEQDAAPAAPEAQAKSAPDDSGNEAEAKVFDASYVSKLRAEAAKYRTEAKALAEKAAKFDEIEASQKSETQKAQEAAEQARKELEQVQLDLMRAKIANAKKLPPAIAERLRGATEDDMLADADALLAELNKQFVAKQAADPQATGAGVKGKAPDYESMSPADLVKMIRERSK